MSIRKGLAYSFGRSGLTFVIQFASNVILARLLLPSEIGVFSVVVAAMAILHALRDFGIGRYLIKEHDLTDAKIGTVFFVSLTIGWTLAAMILLSREHLAAFYAEPQIAELLEITALSFMILPFGQPALSMLRRERRYGRVALIMVSSTTSGAVISVVFAWLDFGPMALAYGSLANVLTTSGMALIAKPDHILLKPTLKEWRSVVGFGGIASLTTLVATLGAQAPELIMGRVLGFTAVGLYSKGLGLAVTFERLIVVAVSFVSGPEFAALKRSGEKLDQLALRATDHIVVLGWPFLIFLAINSEPVILILFGENWLPASPVLQALCVARAISLLVSQAGALYEGSGAIELQFRNECFLQSLAVALLIAGLPFGIVVVAWLRTLLSVASVTCHISVFRRCANVGIRRMLSFVSRAAKISICFAVIMIGWKYFIPADYAGAFVVLTAEAIGALAIYIVLLFVFDHPISQEIRTLGLRMWLLHKSTR